MDGQVLSFQLMHLWVKTLEQLWLDVHVRLV